MLVMSLNSARKLNFDFRGNQSELHTWIKSNRLNPVGTTDIPNLEQNIRLVGLTFNSKKSNFFCVGCLI